MNINSPSLNTLFSSSEGINTALPTIAIEGEPPQNLVEILNFADALKDQIKQLTNMKEIAGQLNENGIASEFSAFFGNSLPLIQPAEKEFDIENTIETLENVLNSLENVTTDEINLETRLQGLVEKTEALQAETFDSFELQEKVSRLAEELQKIQNIQKVVPQQNDQENNLLSFSDKTELLETQIDQISRNLESDIENNPLNLINEPEVHNKEAIETEIEIETEQETEQIQIIDNVQLAIKIPTPNQALKFEQITINPIPSELKPEIKKEELILRQIVEQKVTGNTEEAETDSLLQQENTFRKPGQDNPVIVPKQNEVVQLLEDIDLAPSNEKTLPKFAADIAMLNKVVMNENKEILAPMGKHFAHPEWNKEMGERVLWMFKQAIPAAELKLNPRHLGPITIRVDVSQDQATVAFTAQHAAVKEAIEAAIPKLKEMFSAQQLTLSEVNVSQEETGQKQSRSFNQMENQANNEKSKDSGNMAKNEQETDLLDIADEIEAGRAIASNGILSVFA